MTETAASLKLLQSSLREIGERVRRIERYVGIEGEEG